MKVDLSTKETRIKAEREREFLKLSAEIEHLKAMVAWKSKMAEDDAIFRVENAWRDKTKAYLIYIYILRGLILFHSLLFYI